MEIKELTERVDTLAALRKRRDEIKSGITAKVEEFMKTLADEELELNGVVQTISEVQAGILEALKESKMANWRTEKATVTRITESVYDIVDEQKAIADITKLGLANEYIKQIIVPEAKGLFEQKEIDGVERVTRDRLSVRVAKPKEE